MMTRRDYQVVAECINEATRYLDKSRAAVVRLAFADRFTTEYDNFDALKFWNALDKSAE
jgi:hypothetical protein